MVYKAIIFDLDGTVINTEHLWQAGACELILRKKKIYTAAIQKELAQKMRGASLGESLALIKKLTGIEGDIEELKQEKMKLVLLNYAHGVRFMPGFLSFFEEVTKKGLLTALATNSETPTLKLVIDCLDLRKFFGSHIYNIDDVKGKGKPHPDIYLHAAKQLGVKPSECIAIEDSAVGLQSAKDAGMFCIGYDFIHEPERVKLADLTVKSFQEIPLNSLS